MNWPYRSRFYTVNAPGFGCKHEELEFIGIQEVLQGEPLRLYNCKRCFTTVSRPGEFRTEREKE
jgi:hypothetical protein